MSIEDTINGMSYKLHLVVGASMGFISSVLTDNADQIVLTFVLGVVGALGAACVKLLVDVIRKRVKRGDDNKD